MGAQQLLLLALSLLIVGVAIAVGIFLFTDNAIQQTRDQIQNEMLQLSVRARVYYRTPLNLGGGEHSFDNLTSISQLTTQAAGINATYSFVNNGESLTLTAIGRETGADGATPIRIVMVILRDSAYFDESMNN